MKRSEIEVGGIYSDGKGSVREVLGFLPLDYLQYKVLAGRYKGEIKCMTARSFASWVKSREIPPSPMTPGCADTGE